MNKNVKIFSGNATPNLATSIAQSFGQPLSRQQIRHFSDGEISPKLQESMYGTHAFFVQSTLAPSDHLMTLLLMIDAAKSAGAAKITAIVPYFGYARQDRKDQPGVSIAAKLKAQLLMTAGIDHLITLDLHSPQIQGFFDCPVEHLEGTRVFQPYLTQLQLKNLVFAAPDIGSVQKARTYAQYFQAPMVVCEKQRSAANQIKTMQLIGHVRGADVVLIDDIIDTGGTICKAAALLKAQGARSVRVCCTHPVFSQNAIKNLLQATFDEIIVTDTIPQAIQHPKIKILTVAHIFAQAMHQSIS